MAPSKCHIGMTFGEITRGLARPTFRKQRDRSRAAYLRDEWPAHRRKESHHPRERPNKGVGCSCGPQPLASEDEQRYACGSRGSLLGLAIPYAVVARKDGPALLPDRRQPDLVKRILGKVVVVYLDLGTSGAQGVGDDVLAQTPVNEEDRGHAARRRRSQRTASSTTRRSRP